MSESQKVNAINLLYKLYARQISEEVGQEINVEVTIDEKR